MLVVSFSLFIFYFTNYYQEKKGHGSAINWKRLLTWKTVSFSFSLKVNDINNSGIYVAPLFEKKKNWCSSVFTAFGYNMIICANMLFICFTATLFWKDPSFRKKNYLKKNYLYFFNVLFKNKL